MSNIKPLWGGYSRPGEPAAVHHCYYQRASNNPDVPQLWAYMDDLSYAPGSTARLHVNTTAAHFNVEQCYTGNPDAAWWFDFGATSDDW